MLYFAPLWIGAISTGSGNGPLQTLVVNYSSEKHLNIQKAVGLLTMCRGTGRSLWLINSVFIGGGSAGRIYIFLQRIKYLQESVRHRRAEVCKLGLCAGSTCCFLQNSYKSQQSFGLWKKATTKCVGVIFLFIVFAAQQHSSPTDQQEFKCFIVSHSSTTGADIRSLLRRCVNSDRLGA